MADSSGSCVGVGSQVVVMWTWEQLVCVGGEAKVWIPELLVVISRGT